MIPLTPAEILLLVQARDLLKTLLGDAGPSTDLWLKKGHDGVLSVLQHSCVSVR